MPSTCSQRRRRETTELKNASRQNKYNKVSNFVRNQYNRARYERSHNIKVMSTLSSSTISSTAPEAAATYSARSRLGKAAGAAFLRSWWMAEGHSTAIPYATAVPQTTVLLSSPTWALPRTPTLARSARLQNPCRAPRSDTRGAGGRRASERVRRQARRLRVEAGRRRRHWTCHGSGHCGTREARRRRRRWHSLLLMEGCRAATIGLPRSIGWPG